MHPFFQYGAVILGLLMLYAIGQAVSRISDRIEDIHAHIVPDEDDLKDQSP